MEGEVQVESSEPAQIPAASSSGRTSDFESDNAGSNPEAASIEQTSEPQSDNKPEGFDKVEFTPEQLQRVNRLYGNMKRYESESKEFRALNEALVREFQNLRVNQEQIVSHIQNNDYQEAESKLAQQRTDAWNKGDFDGYNAANDKINEIKIQKKLSEERAKSQPKIQPRQQNGVDGNRVVDGSVDKGVLTQQEADITKIWITETDQNGNFKRPWASDPSDPRNYAAALEAQAVFNSPLFASKPIAEKLREVDRRMGIQGQQTNKSNVLPAGNLTNGVKTNTIKLDPAIEKIAIRTKFGGPKAKTDQDHIDAWKRAAIKAKGSR